MPKKFVTRKKDVPVAIPGSTDDSSDGGSRTRDVGWPSLTEADLEQFSKKFTDLDDDGNGTLDGGDKAYGLRTYFSPLKHVAMVEMLKKLGVD